jgi:glucan biosynthesis protein
VIVDWLIFINSVRFVAIKTKHLEFPDIQAFWIVRHNSHATPTLFAVALNIGKPHFSILT